MAAAILTRRRSLDGARRRGWGELKRGRNKRTFLCKIKVEKRFGNQRRSSIKVEKQRGLCKEKGLVNKKGIAKEPFKRPKGGKNPEEKKGSLDLCSS
jgi:hypothetical protein